MGGGEKVCMSSVRLYIILPHSRNNRENETVVSVVSAIDGWHLSLLVRLVMVDKGWAITF